MKKLKFAISVILFGCLFILNSCSSGSGSRNGTLNPQVQNIITAFSIDGNAGVMTQDGSGNHIAVTVPFGTDVTRLVATFTATGAMVYVGDKLQVSGVTANDFTNPVIYTVTAAAGSSSTYTVRVTVASSSAKEITAFSLSPASSGATVTPGIIAGHDITVIMPFGTDVTSLFATFTSSGVGVTIGSVTQSSGITVNNFTNPVIYTVTAADGSSSTYTVRVTVASSSAKEIITFFIGTAKGVIKNNDITVTMPFGTDVTALVASFTTTGAGVLVGSVHQVSGTTTNNFTNPVIYTVEAADGSTQTYIVNVNAVSNVWIWVSGANVVNQYGIYGTIGVPSIANIPGSRYGGISWSDANGNLWLFGGVEHGAFGNLNDLWMFKPSTLEWTWISGSNMVDESGVYGIKGVESVNNVPGARQMGVSWSDANGNLWLFGGNGVDSTEVIGGLNDLWMFKPSTLEWTWISGSNMVNESGVYGIKGVESVNNVPGARQLGISWSDANGNFWLFGGSGLDSTGAYGFLNDLWMFKPSTLEWTWIGGSDVVNESGVYGTKGAGSVNNIPGSRYGGISWSDANGNLWLFGGVEHGTFGYLNDLWMFKPSTLEWTWISGSNMVNESGVYGTKGVGSVNNVPGARQVGVSWSDANGNLWLFSGYGVDSTGVSGLLNDLWMFKPSTLEWTWISGSNMVNESGVYGIKGVGSVNNVPGARQAGVSWSDANGNFWLFSGYGVDSTGASGFLNDLWKYQP